ncbi:hypothetical protein K461DRAFT_34484 [Myriangium duriaei CBS 260.36]|uniref:Uncharacterized protein n=1 Tax=Myriangium duriaei CBS 260.36 TaxID=1168546 RepID=A0A9P4MDD9_9PEZI|nr:hypothetical protein K461DRAFT_34484 [Myriangium duriaei CBS 260.36]
MSGYARLFQKPLPPVPYDSGNDSALDLLGRSSSPSWSDGRASPGSSNSHHGLVEKNHASFPQKDTYARKSPRRGRHDEQRQATDCHSDTLTWHGAYPIQRGLGNVESSRSREHPMDTSVMPVKIRENSELRASLWRIGSLRVIILLLSLSSSIASVAFLGWLWNSSSPFWTKLVEAQWLTRSATIASAIIRVACSAQAAVATSMLAILVLECRGARLQDVAELSIIRFSTSGPLLSLWTFLRHSWSSTSLLSPALCVLLALTTTALQFTSTILLSGVSRGQLQGSLTLGSHASGMSNSRPIELIDYWAVTPTNFASILEFSEPVQPKDALSDTGVSIRGFLPIDNQTLRQNLRSWQGMAALFDTRVVCARPNITLTALGIPAPAHEVSGIHGGLTPTLRLEGNISSKLDIPEFQQQLSNPVTFNCTIAWSFNAMYLSSGMVLCHLKPTLDHTNNFVANGLVSRLRPKGFMPTVSANISAYQLVGQSYLLWDIPQSCTDFNTSRSCNLRYANTPTAQAGPWQSFSTSDTDTDRLRVSICYDAIAGPAAGGVLFPQDFHVSVNISGQRPQEPTPFDVDDYEDYGNLTKFNASSIREQLGATLDAANRSTLERGVLSLEDLDLVDEQLNAMRWDTNNMNYDVETYPFIWDSIWDDYTPFHNSIRLLNQFILGSNAVNMNSILRIIFMETFNETQNPALAIQTVWTTVLRTAYYNAVPYFDHYQRTGMSVMNGYQVPTKQGSFVAVAILVITHCVLTTIIVILFVLYTKDLVLNEAWTAVLDAWTPEGENLLSDDRHGARIVFEDDDDGATALGERRVHVRRVSQS